MKTTLVIFTSVLLMTTISCSSKEETKTAPVAAVETSGPTHDVVIADRERQIADLETRLNSVRDRSHGEKFGSLDRNRKSVNEAYADLGAAKSDLNRLKAASIPDEFERIDRELRAKIASLQNSTVFNLAE